MLLSHWGGAGILSWDRSWPWPTMDWALSTRVVIAKLMGTIRMASSNSVITSTARLLLLASLACMPNIRGQVAITIMAAQSTASKNGFRIQKLEAIRMAINSTDK